MTDPAIYKYKYTFENGLKISTNTTKDKESKNMTDIKTLIIEAADRRDLTYAQGFNGRAYALMDADWIGYFNTLDEVLEFLDISVEIDNTESEVRNENKSI